MITLPPLAKAMAAPILDEFEGFFQTAYWDPWGRVWTVGTGLTRLNGKPVTKATVVTRAENDAAVEVEFGASVALIQRLVTYPLLDREFAALISLCYNVGGGCLEVSGKPTALLRDINAGKPAVWDDFLEYDHAGGQVLGGLQDRRAAERAVALGQIDPRDTVALSRLHAQLTTAREHGVPLVPHVRPTSPVPLPHQIAASTPPPIEDEADVLMDKFN